MADWAIPQQAKLKYTQLFNLHDRSRSGFLSGLQCRDILLQSGLHRNVLAEIWNLSDIDGDGQLTREEFILAMHLTNQVRSGQSLPTELPPELVPPSYRRSRSISATSVNSITSGNSSTNGGNIDDQESQTSTENVSTAAGSILNSNSFEDKRRENFEKGRAELERRRLKMIEQQMNIITEQLKSSRNQVAEAKAKIDAMRTDRDTKMGLITSLEAHLKTVRDRKAYLQQEEVSLIAIAKDLNLVNPAQAELDQRATQAKQQSINQMKERLLEFKKEKEEKARELADITNRLESSKNDLRSTSEQVQEIYRVYREMIGKAKQVSEEIIIENKSKTVDLNSVWGEDTGFGAHHSNTLDPLPNTKGDPWTVKSNSSSNSFVFDRPEDSASSLTKSFGSSKSENLPVESIKPASRKYKALYAFEARNPDELTINPGDTILGSGNICEPGWLSGEVGGRIGLFPEAYVEPIEEVAEQPSETAEISAWADPLNMQNQLSSSLQKSLTIEPVKYKVLYAFDARNPDELSINPGDIVIGTDGAHEPGWLCGELNGHKGLFPEAYVEKVPEPQIQPEPGKSRSKKAEVATVIANYRALGQEQLNLEKGQLVLIRRKMDSGWWEGEIQVKASEPSASNKLDYLISELIESELDFVNDLKLCDRAYIKPLSKSFDVCHIFVCWNQLIFLHENLLDSISKPSMMDTSIILKSFMNLLNSSTNLYIDYCSKQTESTKNFEVKLASDMRFRQLVSECQRHLHKVLTDLADHVPTSGSTINNWYSRAHGNANLPITNFIIKPIQRITKYNLLFTKILDSLKRTESTNQQMIQLAEGVKFAASRLCEQVNEACRVKEDIEDNRRKLAWSQSHIQLSWQQEGSLDLSRMLNFDGHEAGNKSLDRLVFDSETKFKFRRRLIKAGCLYKLRSGRELVLFLFNDMLILTQVEGGSPLKVEDVFSSTKAQQSYYKLYKPPIPLENVKLLELSKNRRLSWTEQQSLLVSFRDLADGSIYELISLNVQERRCWLNELEKRSNEIRTKLAQKRNYDVDLLSPNLI